MATPAPWTTSKRRTTSAPASQGLTMEVSNLDEIVGEFDDMAFRVEQATRAAAQAAAQVFYDEVKRNVARLNRWTARTGSNPGPGVLQDSIYQAFSKDKSGQSNSGFRVASYDVSWNHKKAPHAHLLEFGHMQKYLTYVDKQGYFHTAVRPEKLKDFKRKYWRKGRDGRNKTVPKALRDEYFIRLPTPRQVPAYPFIRPALDKAKDAYDAATKVILAAVSGSTSNIRMS